MKKNFSFLALFLFFAVFAVACGSDTNNATSGTGKTEQPAAVQELKIKHKLGEATVTKNPKKVVVFDFGALDTLDKLGVEVAGVAQGSIPPYLNKYKDAKYVNVGSLKEPDFEKISSLNPDLILISGRQQEAYPELQKLAPTVYVGVDNARFMESFKENMNTIGQIFGKEADVQKEIAEIEKKVKVISDKAKSSGKNALVILANEGAISAYGPGSRFGLVHDVMGITAVEKNLEVSTHGQSITFEFVAEKNPDYLFVVDRGAVAGSDGKSTASALVENDLVKKTKAFKNGKIVYLDPNYWYLSGGGLVSVSEMINQVYEKFE
ncbi:ABC transporter [Tumebacillus algifaecis]|uniref:ABC transporter n=1 Tax=Tumebacillus algifaecis TaxID=1214604 RepID=A0A223CWK1_9BACL|nr:siderophore ABC transporter substrate-binding protein [Tumebacillus algifaecis]ASS73698.1 ABC transporter [Tumebacillus algifaecis]